MPLVQCPTCGKEISDKAVSCPNCGHPMVEPTPVGAAVPPNPVKKTNAFGIGCLAVIAFIVVISFIGSLGKNTTSEATSCRSDWTLCTDNADMANNYSGWSDAKFACKSAADNQARYGTPEWPWLAFSTFLKGGNYKTSGVATLIEPDAKFSNGFGAMVHSEVLCRYDLRAKKALDVTVVPAR